MASATEETDAAIELALGAIAKLKGKNPGHDLLKYSQTFAGFQLPEAFVQQFGGEHIPEWARNTEFAYAAMCMNYYEALLAVTA